MKSEEFLEAETKEIIRKTHRTHKLVISKLVSTRDAFMSMEMPFQKEMPYGWIDR